MKKLLLLTVGLACTVLLYNCRKQPSKLTKTPDYRTVADSGVVTIDSAATATVSLTSYGFLKFDTPEDYDAILGILKDYSTEQLDIWEETLGFTSSRTVYADPTSYGVTAADNKNEIFEDELFHTLINQDGMVQIGNYLFKTEIDFDKILEIKIDFYPTYMSDFNAGVFEATEMNEFDTEWDETTAAYDNIFDYLNTGAVGTIKTTAYTEPTWILDPVVNTDADCNTYIPSLGSPVYEKQTQDIYDGASTWRSDCKAVYQKAGIYFSLIAKQKYQKGNPGTLYLSTQTDMWTLRNPQLGYWTECTYTRKRSNTQQTDAPPHLNITDRKKGTNVLAWRPYSSMRGLKLYDLDVWFVYYDYCGQPSGVHVKTEKT